MRAKFFKNTRVTFQEKWTDVYRKLHIIPEVQLVIMTLQQENDCDYIQGLVTFAVNWLYWEFEITHDIKSKNKK